MTNGPSPAERDVRADQAGIAAGGDVRQHAGRDAVGRDRIDIGKLVVNPPAVDRTASLDDEQHARLTEQVRRWYGVRLGQALDRVIRLELGLDADSAAVSQPLDRFIPRNHNIQALPAGTSIRDVFASAGGEQGGLLILGEPGVGKTTLLFELAVALTTDPDSSRPTPVYVPLSTWQRRRQPLAQWLAGQLNELYFVSPKISARWVQTGRVLPLLDGLDEIVDLATREDCVSAINEFRRQFSLPVVVCSRRADYELLPVQLALDAAVIIRPLDPDVVLRHLRQAGRPLAGVRAVLRDDPDLLQFCRSPLLLSMLTLAYYGQPATQLRAGGSPEQRREQLFHDYVSRRLHTLVADRDERNEGRQAAARRQRTVRWLGALAHNLRHHDEQLFLLERMQPDWLPTKRARTLVALAVGVVAGGAWISAWVVFKLVFGLVFSSLDQEGWLSWLSNGLPVGLAYGLVAGLGGGREPTERLAWSWTSGRKKWRSSLRVGVGAGMGIGIVVALLVAVRYFVSTLFGPRPPMSGSDVLFFIGRLLLIYGLVGALTGALVTTLLSKDLIAQSVRPNEGTTRSLRNGATVLLVIVLFGVLVGGVSGILIGDLTVLGDVLLSGLLSGLFAGLFVALFYGLGAVLQHGVLRVLLWRYHLAPLRYVRWLEEMVRARLLYRVGGGYEFVHGLLRNYFEKQAGRGNSSSRRTTADGRAGAGMALTTPPTAHRVLYRALNLPPNGPAQFAGQRGRRSIVLRS